MSKEWEVKERDGRLQSIKAAMCREKEGVLTLFNALDDPEYIAIFAKGDWQYVKDITIPPVVLFIDGTEYRIAKYPKHIRVLEEPAKADA